MSGKSYTVLGWIVWQIGSRVAKKKISQNRVKLGAAGVVLLVLAGGIAAAKSGGDDS
jgi:sulfite exporter TauE/SafE